LSFIANADPPPVGGILMNGRIPRLLACISVASLALGGCAGPALRTEREENQILRTELADVQQHCSDLEQQNVRLKAKLDAATKQGAASRP
jgi:hypothetical protein